MPFIVENNQVISFAEFTDVVTQDQRLMDNNEGLTDDTIETALIRATQRIVSQIATTNWWRTNWVTNTGNSPANVAAIPAPNTNQILGRSQDFTDLCVFTALSQYILPSIADFGIKENAELNKIGFYTSRAESLFAELITAGDWYDWSADGVVSTKEKNPGIINLKRVR